MKKLYVFDADGTLRRCTVPNQPCPNKPGEWELLPGVKERLARIDWNVTGLGILSNQGGIALGHLTEATAYQLLCDTVVAATGRWPPQGSIFVCPHAPKAGCACRKPSPMGLRKIMALCGYGPSETLYVGDLDSDRECAQRAGVDFEVAAEFFGFEWTTDGRCVPYTAEQRRAREDFFATGRSPRAG
jgi:HAD superfamily hydrolase (TIGR01662 family)